ncbi:hypothetical protein [Winogradskyella sp. PG-2]|uniref:hypothetical protein n=1 Tax=Winogradskyella sp. PG-2 TaxID=754409 RepID=UPI0004585CC6|nr:hypothetical protein [Winogradskyella sp. PG-2]BAO75854.1 hypothetical protein WPG_1624 [Winogradskyella sp. PG-2]
MKYYIILLFLVFSLTSFAQQVQKDGKIYEVKKEKIFLNGEDVTEALNVEKKEAVLSQAATISEKLKMKEKLKKKPKSMEKTRKKLKRLKKRLKRHKRKL